MDIVAGVNFRTVTVNDVARGPLNEALRGPVETGGLRLQPCRPSGKSGPATQPGRPCMPYLINRWRNRVLVGKIGPSSV